MFGFISISTVMRNESILVVLVEGVLTFEGVWIAVGRQQGAVLPLEL